MEALDKLRIRMYSGRTLGELRRVFPIVLSLDGIDLTIDLYKGQENQLLINYGSDQCSPNFDPKEDTLEDLLYWLILYVGNDDSMKT